MFDTGGGSSQFTFGHGEEIDERFSLNVGAARFTERYGLEGAVSDETLGQVLDADCRRPRDASTGIRRLTCSSEWVAPSRTSRRSSTLWPSTTPTVVQGAVLDIAEVDRQIELYRTRTADQRREIVGLQPKRAEVILAGACIVRTVMTKLERESLTVSDRGLRHGLLLERFGARTGMMEGQ